MTTANFHTLGVPRNQGTGNAVVLGLTKQTIRIKHTEGQPDNGGNRSKGDPAFLEIEPDTDHFFAVDFLFANNAGVRQRCRIRARPWTGQTKAGDFAAVSQTRQVMILLFLGPVFEEQLARTERIRHQRRPSRTHWKPASAELQTGPWQRIRDPHIPWE